MKSTRHVLPVLMLCASFSCKKENPEPAKKPVTHAVCNTMLSSCYKDVNGKYCTFGFKFGDSNPFSPSGLEVPGPALSVTEITFRFQSEGLTFGTHSQENVTSLTFTESDKAEIRSIIAAWESVANISLVEKPAEEKSDITIILADIQQGGLGYPAFVEAPCNNIAGYLVLSTRSNNRNKLALHEMGHVLGLGHVSTDNVMNPDRSFGNLQQGDIMGIQSIYGSK